MAAAAALVLVFLYRLLMPSALHPPNAPAPWQQLSAPAQPSNITQDMEILKQLGAPATFSYQRLCLRAREKTGLRRQSLVAIQGALFSDAKPIAITLDHHANAPADSESFLPSCHSAVEIDVPEFASHASISTSALMLGVATTLDRIEQSLPTFSRWLSKTGSPLLVLLVDHSDLSKIHTDLQRVQTQAEALDIELIFEAYQNIFEHDSEGLKNFGLATALDKHRRKETRWFGVIDDDTFFLSLPRMLDALQPYDPELPWYIGALTEGHTRVAKEGFKAWGGAGFFVSPPLMQTLAEHAVECTPLDRFFGDILWRDCIQEVTSPTVHLTELRGLNQMDLWNDLSGWYEAGFSPILTLHHWKSWHFYPVAMAHVVSDVAGPDSYLQRYLLGNNTVFTNGYSISEYPKGLPDLNLVELTMTEDVNIKRPPPQLEFHHSFGHTRPALELGRDKVQWKLKHSVMTSQRTVRQFYAKEGNDEMSIIEVDWCHA